MNDENGNFIYKSRPSLQPGTKIGVVSPGSWDDSPNYGFLDALKTFWGKKGFEVYIHPQNYHKDGVLAGSDAARAKAFMDMVRDPEIGAIMFARGCTGTIHILDLLNYEAIKANPKPIIGSSDATPLLHAITKKSGVVTFYGPMGCNFADPANDQRTCDDLITAINVGHEGYEMTYPDVGCMREGKAEGWLVGGHMNRMQLLMGTPYDCLSNNGSILFIETVDTTRLEIDNILSQFRLAGKLQTVRGLIVGEMISVQDGETSLARKGERTYGRDVQGIIAKTMKSLPPDIPVVWNFPCGHGSYLSTMPIGSQVSLSTSKENGTRLSFRPVPKSAPIMCYL